MKTAILQEFAKRVRLQDSRNTFSCLDECTFSVPLPHLYIDFIRRYNPINVEIVLKDFNTCTLFPFERLSDVQKEFKTPFHFYVFGALNGSDPFAFKEDNVYMAFHGQGDWHFFLKYNSFESFLTSMMREMK